MKTILPLALLLGACAASPEPFYRGLYNVPADRLDVVRADGFTLVVGPPWRDRAALDRADALGMYVIVQGLDSIEPHPAILGWYLFDEPDLNGKTPAEMAAIFRDFKRRAPGERGFLTVWNPLRYAEFFPHGDILAPDPYPIRAGTDDVKDAIARVGVCVELARSMAHGRPVWAVLPAFVWAPEFPRFPTPDEARAMAFLAIAKGASSIVWFQFVDLYGESGATLRAALKKLNAELEGLDEFLTAPETGEAVWAGDGSIAVSTRRARDATLVIVVNADRVERPGKFSMPGRAPQATTLAPLEVRLLRVDR